MKGIMKDDGSLFKSFEFRTDSSLICRIYSNGEIVQKICSMSTLITEYSLHGRDFLAIHPGTHRSTPCILARDKAILVNLNTIRCIISSESMIMFNVVRLPSLTDRSTIRSSQRSLAISPTTSASDPSDSAAASPSSCRHWKAC